MKGIEMLDMCFGYSPNNQVLTDINLKIEKPGLTSIIGPNGVGKSTLVRCINRLLKPTSGEVLLGGRSVSEYPLKELSKVVAYVPAIAEDEFAMTVLDTVIMGRYPHQQWGSSKKDMKIAYRMMKLLDIQGLAMRNNGELSAGQHQKVAIAKGLAQEPNVLILDEPTSNLDIKHQLHVTEILQRLSMDHNMITIMISHDLNIAAKYSDTVAIMSAPGVIHSVGNPEDVITEDVLKEVYGVESKVICEEGRPHVVLKKSC